jgi:hypothetical protein
MPLRLTCVKVRAARSVNMLQYEGNPKSGRAIEITADKPIDSQ